MNLFRVGKFILNHRGPFIAILLLALIFFGVNSLSDNNGLPTIPIAQAQDTASASPVKAIREREMYYPGTEDLAPDEMGGSMVSLLFASQSAMSALVPVFGGVIADRFGLAAVFYFLAASMLVANLIVLMLPRPTSVRV